MNKKGKWYNIVIVIAVVLLALGVFGSFFKFSFFDFLKNQDVKFTIGDVTDDTHSFGSLIGEQARWFDYIFGEVPSYLIQSTNEVSAVIIIIGIWFLLVLSFGDILSAFSFFSNTTSWVIAFVLTIITANLKLVLIIAGAALVATAGLGVVSVFLSLIMVFIAFILVNIGTKELREWAVARKATIEKIKSKKAIAEVEIGAEGYRALGKELSKDKV